MKQHPFLQFDKDLSNKTITVTRQFAATRDLVWRAWTEHELLDQWWAPEPWRTETVSMDFREGGHWHYAMVGPEGERHFARFNYSEVVPERRFRGEDGFCDAQGVMNTEIPVMDWSSVFNEEGEETTVVVTIRFRKEGDLEKIIEMGFQEGFTSALTNLDRYFETHYRMRAHGHPRRARVSTYLNFPGTAEAAMRFYQQVFNGTFSDQGLVRFGDMPAPDGAPPMSEADKQLIIHAELTILGGHVIMATDASESMGFTVHQGNNMHLNLETTSREETERLFHALSEGGVVSTPLSDMFWGAYFGSFTDKFGINWMLNYAER